MTRGGVIARRYARALFSLGEDPGNATAISAEVDQLTEAALASPEIERVIFTPIHPRAERRGVVSELAERLGLSAEVRAFAAMLVDENRMSILPEIRDELRELVERAAGRVKAQLIAARPLQESELEQIRSALSRRLDREVTVELEVDPELIGGVVARVGDILLDGSIRTQLAVLGESLRKGAA